MEGKNEEGREGKKRIRLEVWDTPPSPSPPPLPPVLSFKWLSFHFSPKNSSGHQYPTSCLLDPPSPSLPFLLLYVLTQTNLIPLQLTLFSYSSSSVFSSLPVPSSVTFHSKFPLSFLLASPQVTQLLVLSYSFFHPSVIPLLLLSSFTATSFLFRHQHFPFLPSSTATMLSSLLPLSFLPPGSPSKPPKSHCSPHLVSSLMEAAHAETKGTTHQSQPPQLQKFIYSVLVLRAPAAFSSAGFFSILSFFLSVCLLCPHVLCVCCRP